MPLALARLQVECNDAFAEQVVPRPMPAVVVAGRHLDGQVHHAELFVDRHLAPHAAVSRVGPGILLPRVVAVLAALRDGVEDPEPLSRLDVVAAHVPLFVLHAARHAPAHVRRADDDRVAGDDGR